MGSTDPKFNWSAVDCQIANEPLAKDGLRKRRVELERIIAPYVSRTKQPTGQVLLFRGQVCYLKPLTGLRSLKADAKHVSKELKRVGYAIRALQFIYHLEAAWKAGDIDRAVRMTVGFSECYYRVAAIDQWQSDIVDALNNSASMERGRVKAGKKSRKWTPEVERLARALFDEVRRKKLSATATFSRIAALLMEKHGVEISPSTVRDYLGPLT